MWIGSKTEIQEHKEQREIGNCRIKRTAELKANEDLVLKVQRTKKAEELSKINKELEALLLFKS
jgi:hypothetical protein